MSSLDFKRCSKCKTETLNLEDKVCQKVIVKDPETRCEGKLTSYELSGSPGKVYPPGDYFNGPVPLWKLEEYVWNGGVKPPPPKPTELFSSEEVAKTLKAVCCAGINLEGSTAHKMKEDWLLARELVSKLQYDKTVYTNAIHGRFIKEWLYGPRPTKGQCPCEWCYPKKQNRE